MKKPILVLTIIILLVSLLLGLTAAYFSSNLLPILEKAIGSSLKATVKIRNVTFDNKKHTINLEDVSVYNPQGFGGNEILAQIPDLTAYYDPHSLFKNNKLHLIKLTLYIRTLTIIKRPDGKLNVENLNISDTDMNLMPIWTDEMAFTLDNVLYKELKKTGSAHVEMFEVNIKNKQYKDLENIDHIATNIVLDAMGKTTIEGTMVYTSATLLGVSTGGASIIAATVISKDNSSKAEFKKSFDEVYNACLQATNEMTDSFKEDKKSGIISTRLDNTAVTIRVQRLPSGDTQVCVAASMFLLPKLRTAKAILCIISQKLNK